MANISISQMNTRAVANLSDLFEVAYVDDNSQTGYSSGKETAEVIANGIVNVYTYSSLNNKTIAQAISDAGGEVAWEDVTGKPSFATVATSGSYTDLNNKPVIDTALDTSSTNAVQNKAIAHELAGGNTQASGDVVTISDGSNLALTSATSNLAPIQDLHGYSSPWVGGAGKNLLDASVKDTNSEFCVFGGTISSNDPNGDVTLPAGTYTFSVNVEMTRIQIRTGANSADVVAEKYYDNKLTFTLAETKAIKITLTLNGGTWNNYTYQLEQGTQATTYAPYSNICPISGYDSANYNRCGKNLFDEIYPNITTGTVTYKSIYVGNGTYTMSTNCPLNTGESANIFFLNGKVNTGASTLNNGVYGNRAITQTTTDGYVTVAYRNQDGVDPRNYQTQIEQGNQATTYQPYQGQAVTLTFDNTIYSGVIDWISGVVTVDRGMVDLGTLTWDYSNSRFNATITGMKSDYTYNSDLSNIICSQYHAKDPLAEWGNMQNGEFGLYNNTIRIKDNNYTDATAFKTAMDGVQLVYELATPTTIQLTPTQLRTLAGYNTIYTDVGNISIAYQPNNVIAECKEYTDKAVSDGLSAYIPPSVFDDKKIMFIGDSFMEGFGARVADGLDSTTNPITTPAVADSTPMRGWAKAFKDRYPKAEVHNLAIYGATIAYQNNNPSVMGQLTYIANNSLGGDYVVIDGGANDVFQGITKGSAKADDVYEEMNWDTMNYNTYQTIPCLEAIFAIFAEHFPTVRILFVSPPPMDVTMTAEMETAVASMKTDIIALCEKWGVKHIDIIGKGSKNTIYSNNTDYYSASDKIHPLQKFYDETIGQIDEVLKQF